MIANAGYETGSDTEPGVALSWESDSFSAQEATAEFAGDSSVTFLGYETFEHGWGSLDPQEIESSPTTDSAGTERFEREWYIDQGFIFLTGLEVASFHVVPQSIEDFEASWGVVDADIVLSESEVAHATTESFATGWGTTAFTLGSVTTCVFNAGGLSVSASSPTNYETFVLKARQRVRSNTADNTLGAVTPPLLLVADDAVTLVAEDGALPTPLAEGVTYLVQNLVGDTCKLAPHPGATTVDLTADGTGANYVVADPGRFWLDEL